MTLFTRISEDKRFANIGYRGAITTIAPNNEAAIQTALWTGPKNQHEMAEVAEHLD